MPHPSQTPSDVEGALLRDADGDEYWEVRGVDRMRPFLVSLVSASDMWAYISSHGALSAGRRDADRALFPYETDDRIHHGAGKTGAITLIRKDGVLWQPFDPRGVAPGRERLLRKAAEGHWLELEERAPDLGLVFRARWTTNATHGLIRRCTLKGSGEVELLDGWLNLMPADVPKAAQQALSTLVDAYKRSELLPGGVGLFAMEARLSDQAAPAEALRANVVWRQGLPDGQTLLSEDAVDAMRAGRPSAPRDLWLGERHAYLVRATTQLPARWDVFGDVHLDHVGVEQLLGRIQQGVDVDTALAESVAKLRANVASADGLQHTADRLATVHHFANVIFNNMRGGVFAHDHRVPADDVAAFVKERNREVAKRHASFLAALPDGQSHPELLAKAETTGDPQLVRLCMEYLPLVFSRRHGDPSRPWNAFSIRLQEEGKPLYSYEGNWRDIFQNWEALCQSFPAYLVPVVAKFVNASTIDGFNPYRITRAGVDWEKPDPDDPWANIGYWGDHQIVYLFRLLEAVEAHHPGALQELLGRRLFSTANVPYRIRPYEALLADAKDTIVFDEEADEHAESLAEALGGDGRLVMDGEGEVRLVGLMEKLLISVLAKLSNLVVDGGIWLNTQRPEWNDANNALVGQGLSMVTLAQLRRALAFLSDLAGSGQAWPVSGEVVTWLEEVSATLADTSALGQGPVSPALRRQMLDRLGASFGRYRAAAYDGQHTDGTARSEQVVALCTNALAWLDHSLRTNRRDDGLYHSYNLLLLGDHEARVGHLYEMLEGQVAVLGSGLLPPAESVAVLDAMFASRLYRADQHSFLLYPFRDRPRFLDRNRAPAALGEVRLVQQLVAAGRGAIARCGPDGSWRFGADHGNADELEEALDALAAEPAFAEAVARDKEQILALYEETFRHIEFTGRSGTMYKYEGLGSIYWHMVSKLLVSVQETWRRAHDAGATEASALADHYDRVRRGLSFNKPVAEYGAIPTDPYSHTPWHLGAQQPGMTGQVKEEVLTRLGELGVRIEGGQLTLAPYLLHAHERWTEATTWTCLGPGGAPVDVDVPAGALAFTLAQVPVVLAFGGGPSISVHWSDGRVTTTPGRTLDAETTAALFARDGQIRALRATLPEADLRA